MSKAKKYYWLKLKNDFFTTREIKKLRKIAGGDTYTIIYLKMQLLSISKEGMLEYEGTDKNIVEQLALELDEDEDNVRMTLSFLEANKLIEQLTEDEYLLNRVPEAIGSETTAAERMRKMRETRNEVTPMLQDVQESYTEIEIENRDREKREELDKEEVDKSTVAKSSKKVSKNPFEEYDFTPDVKQALMDFFEMRKTIKKPMTKKATTLLVNNLKGISDDPETQIKLLEQSILNNWQTIYPLKSDKWNDNNVKPSYSKGKEVKKDFTEREYNYDELEKKLLGWD